ncbi:MAG: twin-arginine translocase TatA/TatE family subunit [Candidatus Eisenbacteria bacterium]|uniref:Sec-independent protein translocase protein TatA n=1 Tax=Eiseniibacteriota bacterium TaxID=2212470 RepID=A0A937X9Q4_UNCEI|nr:twin-arginine translocase TatA/TatE family subunit [Candidatus Eisenbacteria bacterium]
MFGVGTQELLVILLVVLVLFGGKRIPELARSLGTGLRDFRKAVRDVQREVDLESLVRLPPEEGPAGAEATKAPPRAALPSAPAPTDAPARPSEGGEGI